MNNVIAEMVTAYTLTGNSDKKNVIKEILQELVLAALYKTDFFSKAVFNGGTALRIFHGLDRFSEDLDFSLLSPDIDFNLEHYLPRIEKFIASYGIKVEIQAKERSGNVQAAMLRGSMRELVMVFYMDKQNAKSYPSNEMIKVKIEVDTTAPFGSRYEVMYRYLPLPYSVKLYDMPSLFAGKLHAILSRNWKNRVKGRDFYDYIFYLSHGVGVNLDSLRSRLITSGTIKEEDSLDITILKDMLFQRFSQIDFEDAKKDVLGFIGRSDALDIWSSDFFKSITEHLTVHEYSG